MWIYVTVKRSGSLMFVQKRSRELQRRPACRDQLKHDVDRHLSLMHWSILAGCEHQGEAITSRWALLPSSSQKRLSPTQPVPKDVFLAFNLISVSRVTWILNNYSSQVAVLLSGISCKRHAKMGSKLPQIVCVSGWCVMHWYHVYEIFPDFKFVTCFRKITSVYGLFSKIGIYIIKACWMELRSFTMNPSPLTKTLLCFWVSKQYHTWCWHHFNVCIHLLYFSGIKVL